VEETRVLFYDNDTAIIGILKVTDCPIAELKKLLDEYRKSDDAYNWEDWLHFLSEKGVEFEHCMPDEEIYF